MKYFILFFAIMSFHCSPGQDIDIFLIGDTGSPSPSMNSNLNFLEQKLSRGTEDDVLIILGNNIFPMGLPNEEDPLRLEMEKRINAKLDIIKNFRGRSFIIPGNIDWANAGRNGWKNVLDQAKYVSKYLENENVFFPKSGCPGPVEIQLSEELVLMILDTQYLLHPWEKPRQVDGCEVNSSVEVFDLLKDAILRNNKKHILIAGHHPVLSYGEHGTGFVFNSQNLPSPRYKAIAELLKSAMADGTEIVYASAHDHSMQYLLNNSTHHVIAGSGSQSGKTKPGKFSKFSSTDIGFAQLTYVEKGPTQLQFWDSESQLQIYDHEIFNRTIITKKEELAARPDYGGLSQTISADMNLRSTGKRSQEVFLGNVYRNEWTLPVTAPVFDIGTEYGGLEILKRGGGQQTRALRLEAKDGRQYVIRSIRKWPQKAVPQVLKKSFLVNLAIDGMSASHPYGAFVIPTLASAAGIYHTTPTLVAIPDDPKLGLYRNEFAGLLTLFEQRPNNEAAGDVNFGGAEKIVSTFDLIEKLQENNNRSIDDNFLVRNRLFDMWLGDWDRHEDQWRWAQFDKSGKGKLYRPIPRDRDQVFFQTEGIIPRIIASKWAFPMFQGFEDDIKWPDGFNWSARSFDRSFLNQLDWSAWQQQIDELQAKLTDDVIDNAIDQWPDEIKKLSGAEIAHKLKKRRSTMESYGRRYYEYLAEGVNVVGSDKQEYFEVQRLDDNHTNVTVYDGKKKGDADDVLYKRTFLTNETKEIALYGLGGEDKFLISGKTKKGIKVRIIGGGGKDEITDKSEVSGPSKKTVVYDKLKKTEFKGGNETKNKLSSHPDINIYDRHAYKVDKTFPLFDLRATPDDGLFLGGGFSHISQGFRKDPYKQKHLLKGSAAFETGAFQLDYEGSWVNAFGNWDFNIDLEIIRPFGVSNFFGMGNESVFDTKGTTLPAELDDPIDYYRIRYEKFTADLNIAYDFWEFNKFTFGPKLTRFELEDNPDRFISDPTNGLDPSVLFQDSYFGGASFKYEADTRDHKPMPTTGLYGFLQFDTYLGLNDAANNFSRFTGELKFFFNFHIPLEIVIGNRVGFDAAFGNYEFFNGVTLDRDYLRGYRRTRYYGDQSFYHNIDLRIKLFSFTSIIVPGSVGLVGFHDIGRVWYAPESSKSWHTGRGFGIWLSPQNFTAINLIYAIGEDENQVVLRLSHHF